MKKLLSILLSALILSTAFVIVPSTFAKSKNSATYKASSTIYGNLIVLYIEKETRFYLK